MSNTNIVILILSSIMVVLYVMAHVKSKFCDDILKLVKFNHDNVRAALFDMIDKQRFWSNCFYGLCGILGTIAIIIEVLSK